MNLRFNVIFFTLFFPIWGAASVSLTKKDLISPRSTALNISELRENRTKNWGVATVFRGTNIPYLEGAGSRISSFIPMVFYDGERVFWSGLDAGVHLWKDDEWSLNALIRMRFFDLPMEVQNEVGGDTGDYGFQLKRQLGDGWYSNIDLLSDENYRYHGVATLGRQRETADYFVDASFSAKYKSADFNSFYYGLSEYRQEGVTLNPGIDFKAGVKGRYHLYSNLYMVGGAYATYLDKNVRKSPTIDSNWQTEVYGGIAIFNDNQRHGERELSTRPYWRVAYGWGTSSNINEILLGETIEDPYNNRLSSITYGYPVSNTLFGIPIDVFISPSVVWHLPSDVQSSTIEFVAAIKGYYTVNWPTKWRLGVAEGLSYINRVSYIEKTELAQKGYRPSQLLNYIDLSLDVNIGDLLGKPSLNGVWVGYSMHHRSAIFESSSQFGRIKGGSNYNLVYVQIDA